jgi:hypothetical protein
MRDPLDYVYTFMLSTFGISMHFVNTFSLHSLLDFFDDQFFVIFERNFLQLQPLNPLD